MALSYLEDLDSQIPAIQLLNALGWRYISREQALALRGGRADQVILSEVLRPWLVENNSIEVKNQTYSFTDNNILEAIRRLTEVPSQGLVKTNQEIYHLLTLGTSLDQAIAGDRKGRSLHYIDWQQPEKNIYHITDEFVVERSWSHESRRTDVVLFVNGIPFVVMECNHPDRDKQSGERQINKAIQQLLDKQKPDEIPRLFHYVQLLLASSVNDILYGTVGTPRNFWSLWKEECKRQPLVQAKANQPLPADAESKLFAPLELKQAGVYREARQHFSELWARGDRLPTTQDATLWAMLRPQRLLEFVYNYVVFDAGVRKVARHQQFFAVKATINKVSALHGGARTGGVIWHTTGSGKSLTMVMLAKALALHPDITNPSVVLVTDRIDLDTQLWTTFDACGKSAARAKTGEHLVRLISQGKAGVITTVIDKFSTVMGKYGVSDPNPNIFVLVDEGHRTHYGVIAAKMRKVFPNACYIGFTGTPLLKKEKNTAIKFGGFIHSYTMREAVEDQAVVPLLYEGRTALLQQNQQAMQRWFERIAAELSNRQKTDLKRKIATKEVVNEAEQRIKSISFNISTHYSSNFKGTGFKALLACNSRADAILYRRFINDFDMVGCEVIMSQPDLRDGGDTVEEEDVPAVHQFWKEMMTRFGSEEKYLQEIKASFAREDGIDILIVIDKLLTGFDEPRNTVLYVDKPLKEHNILQAIARVNRLFQGKEFGYIVDYRGILGRLNEAMHTYETLGGFDADDVNMTDVLVDTHEIISKLPQNHSDVWAVFKEVKNTHDIESMAQHLQPEDRRQAFYDALREYQNTLGVALITEQFYDDTRKELIEKYKKDLKNFRRLRASVRQRFSEAVDFKQYEQQIRKVMDSHIQAMEVDTVTDLFNIFDVEAFDKEVGKCESNAAKADTIACRVKKNIIEKMEEDSVFYKKFAELVQNAIDEYYQGRMSELEYLKLVEDYLNTVRRGHEVDMPAALEGHGEAQAFYGVLAELLGANQMELAPLDGVRETSATYESGKKSLSGTQLAAMALSIGKIIDDRKIRDWPCMSDVVKDMENALDDYLFDTWDQLSVKINMDQMDIIIGQCINIAKKRAGV